VARQFNEAGLLTLAAFVAPSSEGREQAKALIGKERLLTVYVQASPRSVPSAIRKACTRRPAITSRASPSRTTCRWMPIW
jgi:bifunctional enzyme CysN/CysC